MIHDANELIKIYNDHTLLYYQFSPDKYQEVAMIGYNIDVTGPHHFSRTTVELMIIDKPQYNYDLYVYSGEIHTSSPKIFKVTLPCAELFSYNPIAVPTERADPNDLLKGLVSE